MSAEHSAGSKTRGVKVANRALIFLLRLLWSKEIGQSQYAFNTSSYAFNITRLEVALSALTSVVGAVTARRIVDFALSVLKK